MKTSSVFQKVLLFSGIVILASNSFAQSVGIGTTTPHVSAALEVTSPLNNKGLLIPRVALLGADDIVTIGEPAHSLLVFNTTDDQKIFYNGPGYYYNDGQPAAANWKKLMTELDLVSPQAWLLYGNSIDPNQFMGTTNDENLIIKRNSEEVVQFYPGGAAVFTGNTTTGITPANVKGAGTRVMWIPKQGAFRAGVVDGAEWDAVNIGINSFAAGRSVTASGVGSTALGYKTVASAYLTTAMGHTTAASGNNSTAMGYATKASGFYSTAMGRETVASGDSSTAMGYKSVASGHASTAMGSQDSAKGDYSTAIGFATIASGYGSIAMGNETIASGSASTAMGYFTIASAGGSTAMGEETTASGVTSTAMGEETIASGFASTAMGQGTVASGSRSTAMGLVTIASGECSTVMGYGSISYALFSIANG